MQNADMIYNFYNGVLAKYLEDLIITQTSAFELKLIDVPWNNRKLTINEQGFFLYKDGENILRTYSYLDKYEIDTYNDYPKAHIINCNHVKTYSGYKSTSNQTVSIFNRNSNTIVPSLHLEICQTCINEVQRNTSLDLFGKPWHSIILDLEEDNNTKSQLLKSDGYVSNWNQISWAFREENNWTCERCRWKPKEGQKQFLHVHHKKTKKSNKRSDLQCLCILCHSQVDKHHVKKFAEPERQIEVQYFKMINNNT